MIASRATRALKLPSYLFCIQLYEKPPCRLPKFHINKVGFSTLTHGPVFGGHYNYEIISWILGFGPAAEVLQPVELRNRIAKDLEAAAAQYRDISNPPLRAHSDAVSRSALI